MIDRIVLNKHEYFDLPDGLEVLSEEEAWELRVHGHETERNVCFTQERQQEMRQEPYIDLDVHGMNVSQAIERIEAAIRKANASTYRIRVVHGYNRGNHIQRAIYREIGHGLNPKVLRITGGDNPGITELILREY